MDYGCAVYASACESLLKTLDPIHHAGLRYCLGAFRSTPTLSLCSEAGLPPMCVRRDRLMMSYIINIRSQPTHPNYDILFTPIVQRGERILLNRPLRDHFQSLMTRLSISFPNVLSICQPESPPWIVPNVTYHLELKEHGKQHTSPIVLQQNFKRILNQIAPSSVIYTDGSKCNNGVGSAIVVDGIAHSWTLPGAASVYTAELYAIWQALRFCQFSTRAQPFVIAIDSMSSLQTLMNIRHSNPLAQMCQEVLRLVQNVCFIWVPSHVGIKGNEIADCSARSAAEQQTLDIHFVTPEDSKVYLRSLVHKEWQEEWSMCGTALSRIKPKVGGWCPPLPLCRADRVKIHRLRLGHTAVTHSYLFQRNSLPSCSLCGDSLSVEHMLGKCRAYQSLNELYQMTGNLKYHLTTDNGIRNTLEFLKATSLYNKI